MLVGQVHVLADAGDDDSSPLFAGLRRHDIGHDAGIVVVEVTDGFIGEDEVEGLAESAHHCHTLLLAE